MLSFQLLLRIVALSVLLAPIVITISWCLARDRRLDKLAGPKGNAFVGIGLSLPSHPTRKLREWALQYGELYKVRIGWYDWVVISSPEAMKEIFDKQVCASLLSRL